jgi:phage terminase small subunit
MALNEGQAREQRKRPVSARGGREAPIRGRIPAQPMPGIPLRNTRWEMFALAYVANRGNATQAYKTVGYSPNGADRAAHKLLRTAEIARRIEELKADAWRRLHMSASETLGRIAMTARVDVRQLFNDDGSFKKISDIDDATAQGIAGIETETRFDMHVDKEGDPVTVPTVVRKVRLRDSTAALKILAEHHGLIGSDAQQAAGALVDALADRMEAARRRALEDEDRARTIEAQDMRITHTASVDITSNSTQLASAPIPGGYQDEAKSRPETDSSEP